jgi:hypothetical protein
VEQRIFSVFYKYDRCKDFSYTMDSEMNWKYIHLFGKKRRYMDEVFFEKWKINWAWRGGGEMPPIAD